MLGLFCRNSDGFVNCARKTGAAKKNPREGTWGAGAVEPIPNGRPGPREVKRDFGFAEPSAGYRGKRRVGARRGWAGANRRSGALPMGAQAPVKLGVRGQWSPSDGRPGPREDRLKRLEVHMATRQRSKSKSSNRSASGKSRSKRSAATSRTGRRMSTRAGKTAASRGSRSRTSSRGTRAAMGKKRDTVRKSPKSTRPAASSETLHDREELDGNENTLVGPNTLI